jgi:hypothetical protein
VDVRIPVVVLFFGIVEAQRRNDGPQHVHGKRVFGRQMQAVDDGSIELALFRHAVAQLAQFVSRGQLTEPQQVTDFLESGVVRQFMDVDSAIGQNTLLTIDVADAGSGSYHSLEPLGGMRYGRHTLSRIPRFSVAACSEPYARAMRN